MTDSPRPPRRKTMGQKLPPMTMSDIARMAGVSESTVSRALAGSPLVAAQTRERIMELARRANYSVNEQARNLALGQSRTIEVIFPIEPGTLQQVSDPFFVDMLAALTDELAVHDYNVLLSKSTPWDSNRPGCALLGGRADLVIFVGEGRHRAEIRDFAREHRSVVVWGAASPDADYTIVGSDNVRGGELATAHMLSLGRRSIAFLGDRTLPEIGQRHEGYTRALRAQGQTVRPELVVCAPFDIEQALVAAVPLADLYPAFDGIFAASDMIAIAAIAMLRERSIRVPEDVSVVGFDDIVAGRHMFPSLTTVHQDIRHGGRLIVEKALALLEGRAAGPEVMETQLIVRQSCGGRS